MRRTVLQTGPVRSLVWSGDDLVDWVGGGVRYGLDGGVSDRLVNYAYRFDAVCAHGDYAVIFERLGTKGLILHHGKAVREINRSYYCADDYDYPVCLWSDAAGRVMVAHCPEAYNRIEIEDAASGERLTGAAERRPEDFFHSHLQTSPCGTWLLSAGWVWHPKDEIRLFDIAGALRDPRHLDEGARCNLGASRSADQSSACWLSDGRMLIGGGAPFCDDGEGSDAEQPEERQLLGNDVLLYDVSAEAVIRRIALGRPAGPMMPVGEDAVVTFHRHPRLIALGSGAAATEWPDLPTGTQIGSIAIASPSPPPVALDPANRRFAIARGDAVHVIAL